jgi:hypothetical protein
MIPAMLPKTRRFVAGAVLTTAALVCLPATARADAGIPMLPIEYPTMLIFLLIVIAIEVIYLQARLKTPIYRTVMAVASLNAATTGLGFPLAWLIYEGFDAWAGFPGGRENALANMRYLPMWVGLRMFPNWAGSPNQVWAVLGVFITLLVPGYLLSRILKAWAFNWYDLLRYPGDCRPAVLVANRLSYLLLAITGCMMFYRTYHG